MALQVVPHMKVVEVGAPGRVSVEDCMSKAHDGTVQISDDGIPVRRRRGEPAGPLGHPVSDDVTIKKRIQVRAPIVAPPAFSMQLSDGFSIVRCRLPVLHTPIFPDPASPVAIRAWASAAALGLLGRSASIDNSKKRGTAKWLGRHRRHATGEGHGLAAAAVTSRPPGLMPYCLGMVAVCTARRIR
jgi:hypothetical protein